MKKTDILYENNQIIVCHKEAGVAVQTKKLMETDLKSMILNEFAIRGERQEIYVVHRLDQPVEGIVVFAKNGKAAANLSRQFNEKCIVKDYLAVIKGQFNEEKIHLENYLLKNGKTNSSCIVEKGTKNSKIAMLDVEPYSSCEDTQLVIIHLGTGRHHQIRVQLSGAGHPIVGDRKYNPDYVNHKGFVQTALCAYRLTFINPEDNKKISFAVKPSASAFHKYKEEVEEILRDCRTK